MCKEEIVLLVVWEEGPYGNYWLFQNASLWLMDGDEQK